MKILFLIPRFSIGGAEMLALNWATHMNKEGNDAAVGCVTSTGLLAAEFKKNNINIFEGNARHLWNYFGVWQKLKYFVREYRPDVVHTNLLGADVFGFLLKKCVKIKWVVTLHNVESNTRWWRRVLWRYVLASADQVIVVSEAVREYGVKEFGIGENKIVIIKNGVDLNVVDLNKATHTEFNIATVGRLVKQKGHIYLLRSLAMLGNADWKWHVYGSGTEEKYLRQQAANLGVDDKIIWHGDDIDWRSEAGIIDLIVQPSLWEGMSLVVMESMALGLPVLSSTPAGRDLIVDNETGYVAPAADVVALTQKLSMIISQRDQLTNIATAGRQWAQEHFGIKKNVDELLKVYNSI